MLTHAKGSLLLRVLQDYRSPFVGKKYIPCLLDSKVETFIFWKTDLKIGYLELISEFP